MTRSLCRVFLLPLLLGVAGVASAAPKDARPGQERVVYLPEGTALRERPSALARAVASLPSATRVLVLEVELPWLRVTSRGREPATGWLLAPQTVEPEAMRANPRPATIGAAPGAVDASDVTAAGRQLTAGTEAKYRVSSADLQRAYGLVEQMEEATRAMAPAESFPFILEGGLGRMGRDYARPPLLPPSAAKPASRGGGDVGGLLGRLGGEVLDRLGPGGRGGDIARSALEGVTNYVEQVGKTFTPEQEYYLGRAVAANAIAQLGVDPDPGRRRYVRQVGDAVVRLSDRVPANFGGYHFEVLDSDEVNGISGPGGYVLLTRGAVKACTTEDELAALICHELAHVTQRHGEKTLREGRGFQSMLQGLSRTGASAAGMNDERFAAGLLRFFEEAVGEMSKTAIQHGYGRDLEFAADLEGSYLLVDVLYDHTALSRMLRRLPHDHGAATHASPEERARWLDQQLQRYGAYNGNPDALAVRTTRFQTACGIPPAAEGFGFPPPGR